MTEEKLIIQLESFLSLQRETEWLEFKVNNGDPQEIGEYISALSNSACLTDNRHGYLIYGVEDKTHEVVGTTFLPKSAKHKNQELESWIVQHLSPKIDFRIYEIEYEGKIISIFQIDATMNIPVSFRNERYIRIGSYKKKLKEFPEKERKIFTKSNLIPYEFKIALGGLKAEQVLELLDYEGFSKLNRIPNAYSLFDRIDRLKESKLIKGRGQLYEISNLGAVLYAKDLNDFESLGRKSLRIIQYKGKSKREGIREKLWRAGYAVGFEKLMDYLHSILPVNELIGTAFREEKPIFPPISIRELVANALIHQDFSIAGTGPVIEIFEDRMEITNPGRLLLNVDRLIDANPISRNEKIAYEMRRVGICEERGSGIDKVIFECELFQLPAPEFSDSEFHTRVILFAPKTLRAMSKEDQIRACYQHACLMYVEGAKMTNESLRKRFGIKDSNYSVASRIISNCMERGLIQSADPSSSSKKYASYIPFWVKMEGI